MSLLYKNIGLDLDGVLTEHDKFQLEKGLNYFCKKYQKSPSEVIKNLQGYDVTEIFGCSNYERFFFWGRFIWEYCSIYPPRLGASEITKKWMKEGRNITIITGRKEIKEFYLVSLFLTLLTRYWLFHQKISYQKILFCSDSKSEFEKKKICEKQHIDLMAEDRPNVLRALKNTCRVVSFHTNWNREIQNDVSMFDTFYQMDDYIVREEKLQRIRSLNNRD